MQNYLISIIIPIYNGDKYIRRCLESILSQSYDNYEVLMINDGSTDDTETICRSYSKRDSRFKYYKKANGGVSSARNFALKKCKGKYISFIDADDYISSIFLEQAVFLLEHTNSDIYMCRLNIIEESKSKKSNDHKDYNYYCSLSKEQFLNKLVDGSGAGAGCINKIYKKKIIKNIKFENVAVAEDLYFNVDVSKYNNSLKIIYSSSKLYNYCINKHSVMHGKLSKKNRDILTQYDKLIMENRDEYIDFVNALKASYVFISCKIIIKMVSSSVYENDIVDICKKNIDKYKKNVYYNKNYSIQKKIFVILFDIFFSKIVLSYKKNNIWKKICILLNAKVG